MITSRLENTQLEDSFSTTKQNPIKTKKDPIKLGPVNMLPGETLMEIFSFCDPMVKQNASMVCRSWNQVVIKQAHYELIAPLNFMKDSIVSVLKDQKYLNQKKLCISNFQDILSFKPDNLLQIKSCLTNGRDAMARELKSVEGSLISKVVSCCKSIKMPSLFEKFGILAEAYKKVDESKLFLDERDSILEHDKGLIDVVTMLVGEGIWDPAFEVAKTIVEDDERDEALFIIVKHLAKIGNFEKAMRVCDAIVIKEYGYWVRSRVIVEMAKYQGFDALDKALVMIDLLPLNHRSEPISQIVNMWAPLDLEKSLQIFSRITDLSFANTAQKTIVDLVIKTCDYDKALEMVKKIHLDCTRVPLIEAIEKARLENQDR